MNKLLSILAVLGLAVPALGQTTNVVATNLQIFNTRGGKLTGSVCMQPVYKNAASAFSADGTAQVLPAVACFPVSNGSLNFSVPSTDSANPQVCYKTYLQSSNGTQIYQWQQPLCISGTTFNLDQYAPTQVVTVTTPSLQYTPNAPSGDCGSAIALDVSGVVPTLSLYACLGHSWALMPQGGGGSSVILQTAGTNNTLQTLLNFVASTANVSGLTITPSNPSGGVERFEITGSPTTLNGVTPGNIISHNASDFDASGAAANAEAAAVASSLQLAGGTMTGALTLAADPTTNLGAATKQYVDAHSTQAVESDTVILAASNSPQKAQANVVCSGTADQTCINNAIATYCPNASAGVTGCKITLLDGVYNISAPIVIDSDDVTLTGTHHCMWGGWNHSWVSTSSPAGAIGTGCAQIRASATGYDIIDLANTTPAGTGSDTYRHRGIHIHWLYLVGDGYTGYGINLGGMADFCSITDNVIQRVATGIGVTLDSPTIADNSLQDISGDALDIGQNTVLARASGNLIFDIGRYGIANEGYSTVIEGNRIGDTANTGVFNSGRSATITANVFGPIVGSAIYLQYSSNSVVSANTIDYCDINMGFYTKLPDTSDAIAADSNTSGLAVTGNTLCTLPVEGGYAINVAAASNAAVSGNSITGFWNGGAGSISLGTAANAGNAAQTPALNPIVAASSVALSGRYVASSITGVASGSAITSWPDSSGLGRNLSILSGSGPKYEATSLVHSGPAVRFNGTNDALGNLTFMTAAGTSAKTAFAVFSLSTTAAARGQNVSVFNGYSSFNAGFINAGGNTVCMFTSGVGCATQTAGATSTTYVVEWVWNGTSSRIAVNGASTSFSEGASGWLSGLVIGANASYTSEFFPGDIAEIDGYTGAASTTDAAAIGAALCSAYGVTCSTTW
ncbi:MAG TPA: right-handed parallel beta-helix repeat-containing protein [Acidobacteriaceae bacterium]|jgi:hypothetical protein